MKALNHAVAAALAFAAAAAALLTAQVAPLRPHFSQRPAPVAPIEGPSYVQVPTAPVEPQDELVEPKLVYWADARVLALYGPPGVGYLMVFGLQPAEWKPFPGVKLDIEVLAVLRAGVFDHSEVVYFPIDDQLALPDGSQLRFQAMVWDQDIDPYPTLVTEALAVPIRPYETDPPDDLPPEDLWFVHKRGDVPMSADFLEIPGEPMLLGAHLVVTVPSSGWKLRVDDVLHASRFSRVLMTLERPADDELVMERIENLEACAPLGYWAGKVEIVVRDLKRTPPTFDPAKPKPVYKK
jgi:hypothetical protein